MRIDRMSLIRPLDFLPVHLAFIHIPTFLHTRLNYPRTLSSLSASIIFFHFPILIAGGGYSTYGYSPLVDLTIDGTGSSPHPPFRREELTGATLVWSDNLPPHIISAFNDRQIPTA